MLYNHLTVYGTTYQTTHKLINPNEFVTWTEDNFEYVKYNPRKDIKRFGLSLTSYDGGLSGVPDLDSLYQYNIENNTQYRERDFKTFTPVYKYENLRNTIRPIEQYIYRSHVLKLGRGGFFPPHRDFHGLDINSFRIILPLKNMNPPDFTFIIENQIQYWEEGFLYFVDTAKMHYLFNANSDPVYMIVFNVDLNVDTINFITNNMKHK